MKSLMAFAIIASVAATMIGPAAAVTDDDDSRVVRHARPVRSHAHRKDTREQLTSDQREFERTRAESYDPGGDYAGYPDWARYALSPKGGNR